MTSVIAAAGRTMSPVAAVALMSATLTNTNSFTQAVWPSSRTRNRPFEASQTRMAGSSYPEPEASKASRWADKSSGSARTSASRNATPSIAVLARRVTGMEAASMNSACASHSAATDSATASPTVATKTSR